MSDEKKEYPKGLTQRQKDGLHSAYLLLIETIPDLNTRNAMRRSEDYRRRVFG